MNSSRRLTPVSYYFHLTIRSLLMQRSIIDTTHISTVVNLSHAQVGPRNLLSPLPTQPRSGFKYMHVHDYVQVHVHDYY